MPVTSLEPSRALPRTHCFFSITHGGSIRTVRVRMGVVWSALAAGALVATWVIGSSLYLFFHDDLVAQLMAREAAAQYAYEDRIASLRGQVERQSSLQLVGQTSLEGRLKELAARAGTLEERASLLDAMASRVGGPGGRTDAPGSIRHAPVGAAGGPDNPAAATSMPKPHPEAALPDPSERHADATGTLPYAARLAAVEERMELIDAAQMRDLGAVRGATQRRAEVLRAAFLTAGLSAERVASRAPAAGAAAMGGPFVPLDPSLVRSPFGQAVEALQGDWQTVAALSDAVPHVPFGRPLGGALEVTSPFGARLDPFLGKAAMHTGVDLRDQSGTDVRATAAGRVVAAGSAGGYGVMVEIDHGHGLSTRYAHLSAVSVRPGEPVSAGTVIGEVGATGRATGPHLHYETRIDGEAVDPEHFLLAGARLAASSAAL